MRLKDVPVFPAYLVFHDQFDKGAMHIWWAPSIEAAETECKRRNEKLLCYGEEPQYRAYEKLPRNKRIYKFHPEGF